MRRLHVSALWLCLLNQGLPAQNILNNGGFEYGLMCFHTYVWSTSGLPQDGDYRFLLSNDARSGSLSLEIRCTGADCPKAAADSNRIPTQPNQAYKLKVHSKCAPGSTTAVFIPEAAGGQIFQLLACTGEWAPNTITFTTTATAKDFFFYLFNYWGTPGSWARFDDVVLTNADGTAPQEVTLYPGVRDVRVGERALMVDGAPYLNLGFFDVPYDELAQAAAIGANTVHALGFQQAASCYNTPQPGYLDRAFQLGLNFVPDSSSTALTGSAAPFPAILQRFAPHRAVIAWMLSDEPDQSSIPWSYIPPETLTAQYRAAKTRTSLPLIADFQRAAWMPASVVSPYAGAVDFWMAEPYGSEFQYLSHATNLFNSIARRPIWLAQDGIAPAWMVPKAHWAIINGATGIVYFTWDMFKGDAALMAAAQQAFSELKQLQNVIFATPVDSLVAVSNGLGYLARLSGNSTYILTANPSPSALQGRVSVRGLAAGQTVRVLFENRTITAGAGEFWDTFPGPSRHVYVIDTPLASLAGTLSGKSGTDAARAWRIQVSNGGTGTASGARIASAVLTQTGGTACGPSLVPGNLPVALGNIAAGSSASGDLLINFTGCDNTAKVTLNVGLSANNGGATAMMVRNNERK